jgi:hypothetical protein
MNRCSFLAALFSLHLLFGDAVKEQRVVRFVLRLHGFNLIWIIPAKGLMLAPLM